MDNLLNEIRDVVHPEKLDDFLYIHPERILYMGIDQNTKLPEHHLMDKHDHFLISADLHSQARQFIESIFFKPIQNGSGFIFIDVLSEHCYLPMIKLLAAKANRQADLLVLTDYEFDIVDAINSNKLVVLQIADIHRYLVELHEFFTRLLSVVENKDEAIKPMSHIPLYIHGLDQDSTHFIRLHDSMSCNSVQLNLFYFSEAPHLLNESILANIRHKLFFRSDFNKQIIEDQMFDHWFDGFSNHLQALSDDEVLLIKYRDFHTLNYTLFHAAFLKDKCPI